MRLQPAAFVVVAAFAGCVVGAACTIAPVDPAGRACDDKHACADGFVCVSGACEIACSSNAQCSAGRTCLAGGCAVAVVVDGGAGEGEGAAGEGEGESDAGVVVDAGQADAHAPTIVAPDPNTPQATSHGESVDVALTASDADPGDVVTFVVVAQPKHGSATGTQAGVTYTPNAGFAGFDSIGVAASDGQLRSDVVDVEVYVVGKSCAHILTEGGDRGDGVYTIAPSPNAPDAGPADVDVLCDMSDESGGWTLALKTDGAQPTFCHDKPLWTDNTQLNATSLDTTHVEAKLAAYALVDTSEVLLQVTDEATLTEQSLVVPLDVAGDTSLRDIVQIAAPTPATIAPITFAELAPSSTRNVVHSLDVGGVNVVKSNGQQVRIGAAGTNLDCGTKENTIGVGLRSNQCGGDPAVNAGFDGNNGCSDVEDPGFALVWVRSRNFTFLPPIASCDSSATSPILSGQYLVDADGPGGAEPQSLACDFGDFHTLLDFDFTRGDPCPAPLVATNDGCVRDPVANPAGGPVTIDLPSPVAYDTVRVSVRAASTGAPTAFLPSTVAGASLTGVYVDGVSVTSSPTTAPGNREHVFTFAAGAAGACPCDTGASATPAPAFVAQHFLCDETNPLFDFNAQVGAPACASNTDTTQQIAVTPGSTGDVDVTVETEEAPSVADVVLTKLAVLVR